LAAGDDVPLRVRVAQDVRADARLREDEEPLDLRDLLGGIVRNEISGQPLGGGKAGHEARAAGLRHDTRFDGRRRGGSDDGGLVLEPGQDEIVGDGLGDERDHQSREDADRRRAEHEDAQQTR